MTAEGEPWDRANEPVATSGRAAATDESAEAAGTEETAGERKRLPGRAAAAGAAGDHFGAAETARCWGRGRWGHRRCGRRDRGNGLGAGNGSRDTAELDIAEGPPG